jgi:hypothetical protein
VSDYGPSVFRRDDGRLATRGPAKVDILARPDIDKPIDNAGNRPVVLGARRRSSLARLYKALSISKRQHDAANRLLDDLCRAQGGTAGFRMERVQCSGPREAFSERQRRAIRSVESVRVRLGLNSGTVIWWVVIDNKTPSDYDAAFKLRHGTSMAWLRAALDELDAHYFGTI